MIQSFAVENDELAPTVTINVPTTSGLGIAVSWAGVRNYEVQVKEDNQSWLPWLADVSYSQATYIGKAGHSYTFQIKATDNVNNESAWLESGSVEIYSVTKYYTFGGQKVATRQGDALYYTSGDHLGSTSLTTDDTGAVVSEVRYLPYGQVRWSNGTSVTDFGFTSQRNEASFGLMDYNARYYSPVLGRFISPDTLVTDPSNGGGFNRYRYVKNNPLKYTDTSGHIDPVTIVGLIILAGAGALLSGCGVNEANTTQEVKLNLTILNNSGVTGASVDSYIEEANDIYKQANVTFSKGEVNMLSEESTNSILNNRTDGVDGVLDNYDFSTFSRHPADAQIPEVEALFNVGANVDGEVTVFFVPGLLSGSTGTGFEARDGYPASMIYSTQSNPAAGYSQVREDRRTFPHELGHVFGLSHEPNKPNNLMHQGEGGYELEGDQIRNIHDSDLLNR